MRSQPNKKQSAPSPALNIALQKLADVMAALRDPETGCPWDLQQDFESIAPYTIEEAYEVDEAIRNKDMHALREELGDLLFQAVYHAQIAQESGHFSLQDVIDGITEKMIRRHPHVFAEQHADSAEDVNAIWDREKDKEKAPARSLDDVPNSFPALLRAQKLQKRAARQGFEWPDSMAILDKLEEEIAELREAEAERDQEHIEEELGDLLFVIGDYARRHGINAETALRKANSKFQKRFNALEDDFKVKNKDMKKSSLDELIQGWKDSKARVG